MQNAHVSDFSSLFTSTRLVLLLTVSILTKVS
uniref:Uncharacterized protein n=1 Tax=Arundo donax TaxID=35708 RepID=A0A0A9L5J0_ARUDO